MQKHSKQLKLAFVRWSNLMSYAEKLRLADQVQVVYSERRDLEDRVKQL